MLVKHEQRVPEITQNYIIRPDKRSPALFVGDLIDRASIQSLAKGSVLT